jgi:hypothetical protein
MFEKLRQRLIRGGYHPDPPKGSPDAPSPTPVLAPISPFIWQRGRACPKCSGTKIDVEWHCENKEREIRGAPGFFPLMKARVHSRLEHLHLRCSCGYEWMEMTLDHQ